jgi:hypothetical protein
MRYGICQSALLMMCGRLHSSRKYHLRRVLLLSALVGVLPVVGCSQNRSSKSDSAATITANPNPVPPGEGFGTTKVSWNTGDGTDGVVYIFTGDGREKKFAGPMPAGSLDAPWIGVGTIYEFRLYAGKEPKDLLASVKVVRAEK